jgi:hypothetical protein
MTSTIPIIDAHWCHHFDNLQLSSKEFYSSIEQIVKDQELPKVKMSRVNLSEGGLFSSGREYLRIERNQYIFDICAAPFGKEFFISWWLGEDSGVMDNVLSKVPILDRLLGKASKSRTYYQIDSQTMFKESIHSIILQIIDSIVEKKGLRSLSESDRQIVKN